MAQFMGVLEGKAGQVSRLGSKASGLDVVAASWQGAIHVRLWHDTATGKDMYSVEQMPWRHTGVSRVLAQGVVGEETEA